MFQGIEHTAISSPDPQKLAQWYVDHLEFRINYTYSGNYFVRAENGSMLEIIPADRPLAVPQTGAFVISPSPMTISMPPTPHSRLRVSTSLGNRSRLRAIASSFSMIWTETCFTSFSARIPCRRFRIPSAATSL